MKILHGFRLWTNTWVLPCIVCLSLITLHSSLFAQNVAINATGNQADPSAMLDVSSQTAGVLIPRMGTSARNAISSPATGLQIFNTDCNEVNYWNGTCWLSFGSLPTPGDITSNSSTALCASVTATYSITAITGATGYVWTVPAGAIINSGRGTTSVSVTYGNYSGQICARANDACESSNEACMDINISPIPPTPGNITGLASVNPGQALVTYFIAAVPGAGVYNWSVPSGATITAGIGTPAITVNFSCSAVSGNVSVTAGSNCGTSSPSVLAVTVTPLTVNAGSAVFGSQAIGGSPTATGGQYPYTYSWSPNSNLSGYTVANPTSQCSGSTTTYTVNVTDFNGCSASNSVIVTRNITANAGSAVFGGSLIGGSPAATGGVSPYLYSWSPSANLSGYTVANPTAQCSGSTTTYSLTVTDAGGCTAANSVTVTRNLTANAGSAVFLGSALNGTATGGMSPYSYSWSPNSNLSGYTIANPTALCNGSATTYTLTVTDANGCTSTSSVMVNAIPVASITTNTSPVCPSSAGVVYSLTNVPGDSYVWTAQSGLTTSSFGNTYTNTINISASATTGTNTITVIPTYSTGCQQPAITFTVTVNNTGASPSSIGGLVLWLDASAITGVTNGNSISSWQDLSGNNHNATTSSSWPTYVTNAINGLPVLRFTTSQNVLMNYNFPAPFTVLYVARENPGSRQRVLTGINNNWLLGWWGGAKDQAFFNGWIYGNGQPCCSPAGDDSIYLYTGMSDGSISTVFDNGKLITQNSGGVSGPDGISINNNEQSTCDVAEIIIFNSTLSTANRQAVEAYLECKWGL